MKNILKEKYDNNKIKIEMANLYEEKILIIIFSL